LISEAALILQAHFLFVIPIDTCPYISVDAFWRLWSMNRGSRHFFSSQLSLSISSRLTWNLI